MFISHAEPPLEFIPPAFNPLVLSGAKTLIPWWVKLRTNITTIEATGIETLVNLYQEFNQSKVRFILAFRHPQTDDPLCLTYLLWRLVNPGLNIPGYTAHAHFIYDRGIPLWAGNAVGWLYANLGGTSIQRGKMDWEGLRSARQLFLEGKFPLAGAPEGATNGHNEIMSPLEPGIPQLSFWCAQDLAKAQRQEKVLIVPIGIQYYYEQPPWKAIADLLTQLEKDCGLSVEIQLNPTPEQLYERLYNLGEYLLGVMEQFYQRFYHQKITSSGDSLSTRLPQLLDIALGVAESYFALETKGNLASRCRRLEQAGWDYIYREDFKHRDKLCAIDQGLGDLIAAEASLKMWHMRLVESFVAVTGRYIQEKPSAERFAETILLLWDLVVRVKNANPFPRPKLGKQRVQMRVGKPIVISDPTDLGSPSRFDTYRVNRRQSILSLTEDLQTALTALIEV